MSGRSAPALILITDPEIELATTIAIVRAAAGALGPGRLVVQLRDKTDVARRQRSAQPLRDASHDAGAIFVVNGDVHLASAVAAGGAHVPSHDVAAARAALGPSAFVTTPAHDDDDVRRARACGASAVLVSPIFATPGKGLPRGTAAITSARAIASADVLVYALGGVDPDCVGACAAAGADGVAVIRALYEARDPARIAAILAAPFGAAPVAPPTNEC